MGASEMTYLEQYLLEHKCTVRDFNIDQEDYDGFCPPDVGVLDGCAFDGDCFDCWRRQIPENQKERLV